MSNILKGLNETQLHDGAFLSSAAPEGSPVQQVQQLVQQLSPESKKRLIKKLKTELGIVSEEQLDELSNNKLSQYKTAAASDAGKADSEGDYNRANKRFSGIVKATKKQFANDEKNLKEFAPVGGDDREPNEEEILRQLAAKWWLGTEQEMAKAQKTLEVMGWEIGQDESGDDDAGVFLIRPGDEHGDTYIAFNHSDLEELNEAYNNYHANRTGFTRPKRDLSGEGEPEGMFMVMIDGRPWKEFTSNIAFQRAKTLADKNPSKKIQVRWPSGQLNTVNEGEGRFAGDTPINIGGETVKRLQVGDTVKYFGQKAKILAMSKTGNTSRITIANDMGGVTKDVLTSDLKRTSVDEEKQRLDPHCWDNKKIGNPKTKMKGGVRVNNCVPKESAILKGLRL